MPMPQHCIDCDKVAQVLKEDVPYCAPCYMKEVERERKRLKKKK